MQVLRTHESATANHITFAQEWRATARAAQTELVLAQQQKHELEFSLQSENQASAVVISSALWSFIGTD